MFNFLKKKKAPENLKELVSKFSELEENFKRIENELEKTKKDNLLNIQRIGIVRFNPFKEVGGDQSFSLALLDGQNSGIVVTSLFTRNGNRVYGKAVKNGQAEHLLSDEEKEAIAKATNNQ